MKPISMIALAAAATLGSALPASAQESPNVTVVVNGAPVQFDQPPIERAGRVFVPLRGVFERLGASVVFSNGQINATSGRHTIALSLGSSNATVDGRSVVIDSPPFLVGARTLVPLRFISQALGAVVNFDGQQETVYVSLGNQPPRAQMPPPPMQPPEPVALRLIHEEPFAHESIDRKRPEISSTFSSPVIADSVHVAIDDRDVTASAYVSNRSFSFTPDYDLPSGPHTVVVRGRIAGGPPFVTQWSFASNAVENPNFISALEPVNGTRIGDHFHVRGTTAPNAHVRIVATTNVEVERFNDEVTQGTQAIAVVADGQGFFEANFDVNAQDAGFVDVRVTSTAPDGSVAVRTLRLRP